jgi:hypothetical protein
VITTAPVAAGSLVAGFAVAAATGVRPLGGAVLVAGTAWCAREWSRRRGAQVAAGLVALEVACFVASHLLAGALGAWPSVALVAAVAGAGAWTVADRAASRPAT